MANKITIEISAKSMLHRVVDKVNAQFRRMGKFALNAGKAALGGFIAVASILGRLAFKAQEFNKTLGQIKTLASISMGSLRKEIMAVSAEFGLAKRS